MLAKRELDEHLWGGFQRRGSFPSACQGYLGDSWKNDLKMVKHKLVVNRSILERGSFANPIPDLGYHFIA